MRITESKLRRFIRRRILESRGMERSIREIAQEISMNWRNVSPAARPYLNAMMQLDKMSDMYGMDDAAGIVGYFLSNCRGWKGETAKRVKKELKRMVNKYYRSQGY